MSTKMEALKEEFVAGVGANLYEWLARVVKHSTAECPHWQADSMCAWSACGLEHCESEPCHVRE